ncbi:MAG: glycerol-3-phosphate dehydrogenase [Sphingobacteriales bacterium]|nr:MAG: glycerol-3-phosphate dehydrogenase [Sphingobacteriales bacterium]
MSTLGQIGIIGNGSWGTALAKILTDNGHSIYWWLRNKEAVDHLKNRHHNAHYLTSVRFMPDTIKPTDDLLTLVNACDTLLICVPSAYALQVIQQIPAESWKNKIVISAIKGILPEHNLLLNDYLVGNEHFDLQKYVSITGPCHAEEVAYERLSYLTFSSLDDTTAEAVAEAFQNSYIFTSFNHDIWGSQFAAVLKNIYAIGAGIAHGLDYGDNFLSVYITACYREMYRFSEAHFEKVHPSNERPDFHTSSYLGDLLVTSYSLHSRNRTFGTMVGKGYSVKAAQLEMNMVAEGYYASRGMQAISNSFGIDTPIAAKIYEILWLGRSAADVFIEIERMLS